MKLAVGFAIAKVLLLLAAVFGGCAHGPNPCIGKPSNELPCWCPATTSPECAPWISDAKKGKTCYRVVIGCEEIKWDEAPDSRGILHGKCVKAPPPGVEIPCDDVPRHDGGAD